MSDDTGIVNNESGRRFEKTVEGHTAVVTYSREGEIITFHHTVVPPQLRGRGIGEELAQYVLDYARDEGLQIVPECPFIALYIRRHPEYDALIYDPY